MRVLVPRESLEPLGTLLLAAGHQPVHVPLIQTIHTHHARPQDPADAMVVTSLRAAPFVAGVDLPVWAVGQATAEALRLVGVDPVLVGEQGGVALLDQVPAGQKILYVGAEQPSEGLNAALHARQALRWTVYRTHPHPDAAEGLSAALPADVILFLSGSQVQVFTTHADPGPAQIVVLGPSTADICHRHGLAVHAIASRPTLQDLVKAIR